MNIVDYRSKHGPFQNLESVTKVPLLKHKSALVVFNAILNPPEKKEKKKSRISFVKYIRPEVDREQLEVKLQRTLLHFRFFAFKNVTY